ncbi:cytochrome c biogenesis protein [Terribacillus aidingensis]|uniref:Cytochrome c biogenesis protein n=1 Tax=Terribacillus aidingensis TaxID=586416 RepID=A0A285NLS9_9BACI|nr:cytochrome c biogenesis protein ResB [Terribacillus aidingensis]SNZ10429.1 cytochrome c biogenesis protein [Terribacillus aidingensis]
MRQCPVCKKEKQQSEECCSQCEEQQRNWDMRYDGAIRKSQQQKKTIIDTIWRFFSSVRNGMYILIVTLLATALGTILPQRAYIPPGTIPEEFYASQYGLFGRLYHYFRFDMLYSSWWYMTLLGLLGASILISSIDRFFPLYRALKKQPIKRHVSFLRHQKYIRELDVQAPALLVKEMTDKRYRVRQDGEDFLAEKNRFARWGPYVNHIGLLFILTAAFLRLFPFFYQDSFLWIRDEEIAVVPNTNQSLFIKNERFLVDTYNADDPKFREAIKLEGRTIPKSFTTDISIFQTEKHVAGDMADLDLLLQTQVGVNHPVKAAGYTIYQSGYQLNELSSLTFRAINEAGQAADITIDTKNPDTEYQLENGLRAVLVDYYPDYQLDGDKVITVSKFPRNPAFVLEITDGEHTESVFAALDEVVSETGSNRYNISAVDFETHHVTGLSVKRDRTLPVFLLGGIIFMIGLIQGLYWQHRRLWLHKQQDGTYLLAGHTNKHTSSFEKEADRMLDNYRKGGEY